MDHTTMFSPCNTFSVISWNTGGVDATPNGYWLYQHNPSCLFTVTHCLDWGSKGTCKYTWDKSSFVNLVPPARVAKKIFWLQQQKLINLKNRVYGDFKITTDADLFVFFWNWHDWCYPITVVYFLNHTQFLQLFQISLNCFL